MKKHNLWDILLNRFFILFNLTKTYERPSKDENISKDEEALHTVKATVLPDKETVMIDEFSGFTKTKIKIGQVYKGTLTNDAIITICEPYYEGYYGGKKCIIVHESYEPLVVGKTYTFLLAQDEEKMEVVSEQDLASKEMKCYKELYHKAR